MYPAIRSSIAENEPDISEARTIETYSGPKSLGYLAIASENCLPLSTSSRRLLTTFLNPAWEVWSAMPSSAERRLMPARIITASCVVKSRTFFEVGLRELSRWMNSPRPVPASAPAGERAMTCSPWPRSAVAAVATVSAATIPAVT